MNAVPVNRMQTYFQEALRMKYHANFAEHARHLAEAERKWIQDCGVDKERAAMQPKHAEYYGGPTELMQALDAQLAREDPLPEPPTLLVRRRVESKGDLIFLWVAIGVLALLLVWRW